jgi:Parkin co-regulated protein
VALNTRDYDIMGVAMKVIQKLVLKHPKIGESLVPYYRQLLPMFNLFKTTNKNIGDNIEFGQRKDQNIGDIIN